MKKDRKPNKINRSLYEVKIDRQIKIKCMGDKR